MFFFPPKIFFSQQTPMVTKGQFTLWKAVVCRRNGYLNMINPGLAFHRNLTLNTWISPLSVWWNLTRTAPLALIVVQHTSIPWLSMIEQIQQKTTCWTAERIVPKLSPTTWRISFHFSLLWSESQWL